MKIIKSLSMLTALLIVGACTTAPESPTADPALVNLLGGKTIELNSRTTAAFGANLTSASINGIIDGEVVGGQMKLKESTSSSAAFEDSFDSSALFTVSSVTSSGGNFSYAGTTGTFTYRK